MTQRYIVHDDFRDDGRVHIESTVSTVLTLCGWVDVNYEVTDKKADCPECIALLDYCKTINRRETVKRGL